MSRSRKMSFISVVPLCRSPASPPPCPSPAHIDMYVIRARVATRVDAETPHQVRVLELDDLHRQSYHAAVDRGDSSIAVCVDRHIRGVAVLVLAVARRPPNPPVMLGRPKSRMHIDLDVHRLVPVPARDLRNHELKLVQQLGVDRGVARPHTLLVV